ncbi:DUF5959 family protein [Streptomyces sp. NPDC057236]|uniref:DUF5959 family protein n=1 Tax=Streptomyces sp. NPDC057236 TaxID=3346059 RepID=UPI00362ACB92
MQDSSWSIRIPHAMPHTDRVLMCVHHDGHRCGDRRHERVRPGTPCRVSGPGRPGHLVTDPGALTARCDVVRTDDGRNPEIRFGPSGRNGVAVVMTADTARSGTPVRVSVRLADGRADEHHEPVRRVRRPGRWRSWRR